MPDILPVSIIPPEFAEGYCPASIQAFANDLLNGATLQGDATLDTTVISETAPANHTKLWFKLDGSLNPFAIAGGIPLFKWSNTLGTWVARHPALPGTHRWEEFTAPGDIDTYEGGTAGAVTDTTGPFWEIDTDYNGRSPMSPGAIPTANPAKTLGYGENYGEGAHTQLGQEVGTHTHPLAADADITNTDGTIDFVQTGSPGPGIMKGLTGTAVTPLSVQNNTYTTTQQAMPVLHPIRGMSAIRRTTRLYFVG